MSGHNRGGRAGGGAEKGKIRFLAREKHAPGLGESVLNQNASTSQTVSAWRSAAQIASAYAAWAIFWIVMSDTLVAVFLGEQKLTAFIQSAKGLVFILITAVLLFLLIIRHSRQLIAANARIALHLEQLHRDIADRARAELALQESEIEFRSLVAASAQIVWHANAAGETTEVSSAFADVTGFDVNDALGLGWLEAVHPEDRMRAADNWARVIAKQEPYHTEYRMRTAEDAYRVFEIRGVPVRGKDSKVRKWVGTCADIEDRRKAEEAVRWCAQAGCGVGTWLVCALRCAALQPARPRRT